MATKLTLIDISSGFKGTDIQTNFTSIEDEFDKVVYRDGTSPNQMTDHLDLNSNRIVNLANAVNNSDAATLADVQAQTTEDATSKPASAITVEDSSGYYASGNVEALLKELIDTPLTFTADHTLSGSITLSGGGALSGTFSGNPTLSGNPNFTGTPTKSGSELVSSGGGDFPNVNADVTATDEELNKLDGFTGTTSDLNKTTNLLVTSLDTIVDATNGGADDLTEIDFTGITSDAKKVTILLSVLSLSGTDDILIQIGDSGGIESSSYISTGAWITGAGQDSGSSSSGFHIEIGASSQTVSGAFVLNLMDNSNNLWTASYTLASSDAVYFGGGKKALSGVLDKIKIKSNGANTFDTGEINILVE